MTIGRTQSCIYATLVEEKIITSWKITSSQLCLSRRRNKLSSRLSKQSVKFFIVALLHRNVVVTSQSGMALLTALSKSAQNCPSRSPFVKRPHFSISSLFLSLIISFRTSCFSTNPSTQAKADLPRILPLSYRFDLHTLCAHRFYSFSVRYNIRQQNLACIAKCREANTENGPGAYCGK